LLALPQLPSQIEEALALAVAAGQEAMHQGAQEILVAAAHRAGTDRRSQQLLGVVVRGRDLGIVQEHEPLAAMGADVVVQAFQFRTS
jgi:hypothetical protein